MAQFEIYLDQRGKFPWRLRADDAVVIAVSPQSYASDQESQSSIAITKALALEAPDRFVEIFEEQQGRFRWRLRLGKQGVFAVSPGDFPSRRDCELAIAQMRRLAPAASVVDQTQIPGTNLPPVASFIADPKAGKAPLRVSLDASASSDPDGAIVRYVWDFGDGSTLSARKPIAEHTYDASADDYALTLAITDNKGATGVTSKIISVERVPVPPDPSTVAPPLDPTATTDLASATNFLYTGNNPIQTGVAPGTITARRAAVLRGRVLSTDGSSLPAVTVTVLDHPEYGQTLTRADGAFDLAVNGGGSLTVRYEKNGLLSAQRQVDAPWQDFTWLPDVVMVSLDAKVTTIDLSSPDPPPPARAGRIEDQDGTRQATLLFPQGTGATMRLPDGTTQELATLRVRATEFTVGDKGPAAMPAGLPPSSAFTYASELSVDEALAAGASKIDFDRAVPFYVENFLGFSVGTPVPAGYYDREKGQWIASENGRVIQIVGLANGKADIDSTGDGLADADDVLAALGIDEAERRRLAQLYASGQSLWRVPVRHFSPWDFNWPYGPPDDATPPNQKKPEQDDVPDDECQSQGSIIGSLSQTLGQALNIVGTRSRLYYQSDRGPGRKASYTLGIPLSGSSIPATLKGIDLHVRVAGQIIDQSFPASPHQSTAFTWDGKDAYGRIVQGTQPVTVRVDYVYGAVYRTPAQLDQAFAAYGGAISGVPARREVALSQQGQGCIGAWDARAQSVGGWSLGVHHGYDTISKTVYLGDGGRRSAAATGAVITTVAGNGISGFSGDGGPATQAALSDPFVVTVGPDGNLYIADRNNNRIRRVGPDGIIITVAGNGISGFSGDGGPATQAALSAPFGMAVGPDGSLYIGDRNNRRVRRVGPDGIITTVAGDGQSGFSGDGGPATQAALSDPIAVAVGPDGSLYIADRNNNRVRRVGPDGIITTVAGDGQIGFSGDGGLATQAALSETIGVAVGPDGSLYIVDRGNNRIRRVGPDGIIITVAGNGRSGFSGDGGHATQAAVSAPFGMAVGPDGNLYIADSSNNRIRRVGPDGIIITVAGNGQSGFSGDGGPPTQAALSAPFGVAVGPDGNLYIAEFSNQRVRKLAAPLPGFAADDVVLAAEDGSEVYAFHGPSGRHLLTLDARTGAVRYEFSYDAAGLLSAVIEPIIDNDGNVTQHNVTRIERDAEGEPVVIIAPFGQRTGLEVNADGYLSRITNPAGEATKFSYTSDGLLISLTDPRGGVYRFTYDEQGRMTRDEDPAGGSSALAQTKTDRAYKVVQLTALLRESSSLTERLPTGDERRVNRCCGMETVALDGLDGTQTITTPDGTKTTMVQGPDPRWGMQSPLARSVNVTTPGGLSSLIASERKVALADPNNPFGFSTQVNTVSFNGRTYTRTDEASTRKITEETPEGRQTVTILNARSQVAQMQVGALLPTSHVYDDRGRLKSTTQGTGADARSFTFAYDSGGDLETTTDPLGRTTRFGYDDAGRLVTMTLPDGQTTRASYDSSGNLSELTPPGRSAYRFTHTQVNLLSGYDPPDVDGLADRTLYTYNKDRQLSRITNTDVQTVELGYDNAGRLETVMLPGGQVACTYEETTGNLKSITSPDGIGLSYGYDGALLKSETWAGPIAGSVSVTYDNNLRVISQRLNDAHTINHQYDNDDLLTKVGDLTLTLDPQNGLLTGTTLGALTDQYSYNGFGEATSYSAAHANVAVYTVQYARDKLGRITQRTETINNRTDTHVYTYDAAGRLRDVTKNGTSIARYDYDANGNRLSHTGEDGTSVNGTYDGRDRLSQYGNTTYSYTANGDLKSKTTGGQTASYEYDVLGNVKAVTLPDGKRIAYLVDGLDRRIGKKVDGTLTQGFLYEGQLRPIAELDSDGNIQSRFVYATRGNVPDYIVRAGTTYRIITDHLDSPKLIIDTSTGEVVQRIEYDEFGNITTDTNPGFQPFGFAGGIYDHQTKLTRFGARDYDAETGRWTARDPSGFAGGGANLYAYVLSDPVNLTDRTGASPKGSKPRGPTQKTPKQVLPRIGDKPHQRRTITQLCTNERREQLRAEKEKICNRPRSCSPQGDTCDIAITKWANGNECVAIRTTIQQECWSIKDPEYQGHMDELAKVYGTMRHCWYEVIPEVCKPKPPPACE